MVEFALAHGFTALGFSGHSPLPFANRFSIKDYPGYCREIRSLQQEYAGRIDIRLGLEIDYIPGLHEDFAPLKEQGGLDYVIGSVHLITVPGSSPTCVDDLWYIDGPRYERYDEGLFRFFDGDIRRHRLHFGLVFQNFNLFPQYTALGNVSLAPRLQAKERPDFKENRREILNGIEEKCTELLRRVGLGDKPNCYPHQLSGGQQQRVAIARALALTPEVLFFDEPTSALDPELTGEVLNVIRQLAKEKMTMVIVTHEMAFAEAVSDQVMFIDSGVVVEQASPEILFHNPSEERTRRFLKGYERS